MLGVCEVSSPLQPAICQHLRQRNRQFHYHRRVGKKVLSRSLQTECPTISRLLSSLIDLYLENTLAYRAKELFYFADLKKELEQAYLLSDSVLKVVIDRYIDELYEAEEAFTPVESVEDAKHLMAYTDKVRAECRVPSPLMQASKQVAADACKPAIPDIYELFNQYCEWNVRHKKWKEGRADRNTKDYKVDLKKFVDLVGNKDVRDYQKQDVREFKDWLVSHYDKKTPTTKLKRVSAFFSWLAKETDYLPASVFKETTGLSHLKSQSAHAVTRDEMIEILNKSDEKYADILRLYYFTGCRTVELLEKYSWETVDNVKCLRITDAKTEAGNRHIPLHHSIEHLYGLEIKDTVHRGGKLNKAISGLTERHLTINSFRQGMADRLRQVENCPSNLQNAIMGHSQEGTGDKVYGDGWKAMVVRMKGVIDQLESLQ